MPLVAPPSSLPPPRVARLVMVSADNHNKFYEMAEEVDGTLTVRFGRIGSRAQEKRYPAGEWESRYREKLRKGYRDVTALAASGEAAGPRIENAHVRQLVRLLTEYANASISRNYVVSAGQVTPQQVAEAQALLDELVRHARPGADPRRVNDLLLELYRVIPRRMQHVPEHLVGRLDAPADAHRLEAMLAEEQATLDVMAGQVRQQERAQAHAGGERPGLREWLGIEVAPVEDEAEAARIRALMGDEAPRFRRAFAVTNPRTAEAFRARVARARNRACALLWHGSRNENWLSILQQGLALHPASAVITGKMFGYGLYFADQCRKSLGYTSLHGSFWAAGRERRAFLALYEVHTGRSLHIRQYQPWCSQLTESRLGSGGWLRRRPYDSVFAERGADLVHNEYVVYNEAQCTVRYLVEIGS